MFINEETKKEMLQQFGEEKHFIELLEILGYDKDEELEIEFDGCIFNIEGFDYEILDPEEVEQRLHDYISETLEYFNPSFLEEMTGIPSIMFDSLEEGNNETVLQVVNETCGIMNFIDQVVQYDGVGHFLNSYNGEAYELSNGLTVINC